MPAPPPQQEEPLRQSQIGAPTERPARNARGEAFADTAALGGQRQEPGQTLLEPYARPVQGAAPIGFQPFEFGQCFLQAVSNLSQPAAHSDRPQSTMHCCCSSGSAHCVRQASAFVLQLVSQASAAANPVFAAGRDSPARKDTTLAVRIPAMQAISNRFFMDVFQGLLANEGFSAFAYHSFGAEGMRPSPCEAALAGEGRVVRERHAGERGRQAARGPPRPAFLRGNGLEHCTGGRLRACLPERGRGGNRRAGGGS